MVSTLNKIRQHFPQIAIAIVLGVNLQCAAQFLFTPSLYTSAFELAGVPGDVAIRGFGILFVMWNIPYLFALYNPITNRVSYLQAVLMQTTGFIAEIVLYFSIPFLYSRLQSSLFRFIVFDGIGLLLLMTGYSIIPGRKD